MTQINTFFETNKGAHQIDVRSKIFILLTFSVAIFFVDLKGLSLLFLIFILLVIIDYFVEFKDRPQEFSSAIKAVLKVAFPLYIICIISFLANAIVLTGDTTTNPYSLIPNEGIRDQGLGISSGSQEDSPTIPYSLVPSPLGVTLAQDGILRGIFYCGRILLLGWSSLYVANTVSLIQFASVFKWMFWPLRKLKVPVQDASLAVSIALRFIPEIFFEFESIREAQWCRGAKMTSGGLVARTRAHAGCFVPLLVRMMLQVDALAEALLARCYGVCEVSPEEEMDAISPPQVLITLFICVSIIVLVALI